MIGEHAFANCSSIVSLDIPDSVTEIGYGAFFCCKKLESISVGIKNKNYTSSNGVLYNKAKSEIIAFPACNRLSNFVLPKSVKKISYGAFAYCLRLKTVVVPDSVKEICYFSFYCCFNLKEFHSKIKNVNAILIDDISLLDCNFDKCILYVSESICTDYKHHPVFSQFKNTSFE